MSCSSSAHTAAACWNPSARSAPLAGLLWLFTWLCVARVAAGTLVLFAILGTQGQLIALLLFVYLGLASAGGTVPIQGEVGTAQGGP